MDEFLPDDPATDELVGEFLIHYQERAEGGAADCDMRQNDTAVSPEVHARIERAARCIDLLLATRPREAVGDDASNATRSATRMNSARASQQLREPDDTQNGADAHNRSWRRLGRFEIREELGSGGFGIVYLAWDPRIARLVALKIPRYEALASAELQSRFEQEAQAAARLDHPHIVPVLEAGVDGVMPYIASKYYSGATLARWLELRSTPVDPRDAAALVEQLAEAVEHAHRRGVLHRDIKPSNVLLAHESATSGQPNFDLDAAVPKLMDFGLAKLADGARDMTRSGAMLGTVRYMAPEQAAGRTREIGPAADVYSLGAVLYELLTGAPPFSNDSDLEVLRRVMIDEPSRIRQRRPDAPRDLETICAKCLEKDPARRYASAAALAGDVRRFLMGETILARSASSFEIAWKWARRRPAVASLLAVCVVSLLAGTIGSVAFNIRMRADAQRLRKSESQAQDLLYAADMQLAQQAMSQNSARQVVANLERWIPAAGEEDRRGFPWRFFHGLLNREIGSLPKHPADVYGLAYAPDGKTLATICRDGQLRLWKLPERTLLCSFINHPGEAGSVVYSADGTLLATGGDDGRIVIRETARLDRVHVLSRPAQVSAEAEWKISGMAFSRDHQRMYATAGLDLCCWSVPNGDVLAHRARVHDPWAPRAMSLSADDELLMTLRGTARFWQAADLTPANRPDMDLGTNVAQFQGLGRQLVVGHRLDMFLIDLKDTETRTDVFNRCKTEVRCIDALPDGSLFVCGSDDGSIQATRPPRLNVVYRKHTSRVWCVRIAPDGRSFASAAADGEVYFWEVPNDICYSEIDGAVADYGQRGSSQVALAASPDKRFVATANTGQKIVILDLWTDRRTQIEGERLTGASLCFTPDSRQLISASATGQVKLWDMRTVRCVKEFTIGLPVDGLDLCTQANRLAMVSAQNHSAIVCSWPDCQKLARLPAADTVDFVRFSPDARKLLVGGTEELACYDALDFRLLWRIAEQRTSYKDVDFLDGGATIVVAEFREGVALREIETGTLIARLNTHPGPVAGVAASPDGKTFVGAFSNKLLAVWDRKTLQPVLKFGGVATADRGGLRFSADGDRLFALDGHLLVEYQAFDPRESARPKPDFVWPDELDNGPQRPPE